MALPLVENYVLGKWTKGTGDGKILYNAYTGDEIYRATSDGIEIGDVMDYSRTEGQSVLRN